MPWRPREMIPAPCLATTNANGQNLAMYAVIPASTKRQPPIVKSCSCELQGLCLDAHMDGELPLVILVRRINLVDSIVDVFLPLAERGAPPPSSRNGVSVKGFIAPHENFV